MEKHTTERDEKRITTAAVMLAAGSGSRMGGATKKQYLALNGKPLITHALQTFEDSFIDAVLLVTAKEDVEKCEKEIVERFHFSKVCAVVAGGKERCHSVAYGLRYLKQLPLAKDATVFIHDGARPFVTIPMLQDLYDAAQKTKAAVAAMPVKNTIKSADQNRIVTKTLDRSQLWEMQTPQVFAFDLIADCYERLLKEAEQEGFSLPTDDAALVERYTDVKVQLVPTSYQNLKVTTPEDLILAQLLCENAAPASPAPGSASR